MPTLAQIAANIANAQASTGPSTEAGKAASSHNSLKAGLFTEGDFIRPGEQNAWDELESSLETELSPVGVLERNLIAEILSAMWRLRRCRLVEATFLAQLTNGSEPIPDPIQNEATAKFQLSVDRARNQANRLLHKATAELRRIQTERHYRNEVLPEGTELASLGVCDFAFVVKDVKRSFVSEQQLRKAELNALLAKAIDPPDFTKRTQSGTPTSEIARNSPCPCNSGQKYKRCCGLAAPPMQRAA